MLRLICFFAMYISLNSLAQPGYNVELHELNFNEYIYTDSAAKSFPTFTYVGFPTEGFTTRYEYHVDSSTDLSRLHLLSISPQIRKLVLRLDFIPKELIKNGQHLEELIVENPNVKPNEPADPETLKNSVLTDLDQLTKLHNLSILTVKHFTIRTPQIEPAEKAETKGHTTLNFDQCNVENVGYNAAISELNLRHSFFREIDLQHVSPNLKSVLLLGHQDSIVSLKLPEQLDYFGVNHSEKVKEVHFTDVQVNRFLLKYNPNIEVLDGHFTNSELELLLFNSSINVLPDLFKAIQSLNQINEMTLELPEGTADISFLNDSLRMYSLELKGQRKGKTVFRFGSLSNVEVRRFSFLGDLANIPNLSSMITLETCILEYTVDNPTQSAAKLLNQLHNIRVLYISGLAFQSLPASFFVNNPKLIELNVYRTSIRSIDFGEKEWKSLQKIMLSNNYNMTTIPDPKYYPFGFLTIQNAAH